MTNSSKITSEKKRIFIIGSKGRLAKAIAHYYKDEDCICLSRNDYEDWGNTSRSEEIKDYFQSRIDGEAILFITSGILNSKEDHKLIDQVNFHLPWNIISSLDGLNMTIATFGTILENLKDSDNPYVKSKIKLSDHIASFESEETKVSHFRLHTLYGYDNPSKFMFLGQIYDALKRNEMFNMSSGYQIREYHHLDDIAKSIDVLLSKYKIGVQEITSGNGIRLRDLALCIFAEFKASHLLKIGELDIEHKDKFLNDYSKNNDLMSVEFRDPKQGVNDYLRSIL